MQHALPGAIQGALGEVAGFAGGFVFIANYEARLITVVTLWAGEDCLQRCNDNLKWVRALLAPYLDRCLRIQTQAAFLPDAKHTAQEFAPAEDYAASNLAEAEAEEVAIYAA